MHLTKAVAVNCSRSIKVRFNSIMARVDGTSCLGHCCGKNFDSGLAIASARSCNVTHCLAQGLDGVNGKAER